MLAHETRLTTDAILSDWWRYASSLRSAGMWLHAYRDREGFDFYDSVDVKQLAKSGASATKDYWKLEEECQILTLDPKSILLLARDVLPKIAPLLVRDALERTRPELQEYLQKAFFGPFGLHIPIGGLDVRACQFVAIAREFERTANLLNQWGSAMHPQLFDAKQDKSLAGDHSRNTAVSA